MTLTVGGIGYLLPWMMEGMLFNGILLWGYGLFCIVLLGVTGLSGRFLDGGSARSAGIGGPLRVSLYQWAIGAGTAVVLLLPGLLIMALGGWSVHVSSWSLSGIANGCVVTALLLSAATIEELLFRGYGFLWWIRCVEDAAQWGAQRLMPRRLPPKAMIRVWSQCGVSLLFCVVFAVAHAGNHGASGLALFNTFLAGIWLCLALFRSGALWYPIGLHWGWNWGQGVLFGLPVSGNGGEEDTGLLLSHCMTWTFEGPDWLSGGAYGIEGSIGCTVALCLGCVMAWRIRPRAMANRAIPLRFSAVESRVGR